MSFGLYILLFASLPLFPKEVNEINKQQVIGMKPSSPLEFSDGKEFWWLTRGGNTLAFHNSSDELIVGLLVLEVEGNPCKKIETITANVNEEKEIINIELQDLVKISIPLEIKSKSEKVLNLNFTNIEKCILDNGDTRDFGGKLISWAYR